MKYIFKQILIISASILSLTACSTNTSSTDRQPNSAETQKQNSRHAQDELSTEISRPSRSY